MTFSAKFFLSTIVILVCINTFVSSTPFYSEYPSLNSVNGTSVYSGSSHIGKIEVGNAPFYGSIESYALSDQMLELFNSPSFFLDQSLSPDYNNPNPDKEPHGASTGNVDTPLLSAHFIYALLLLVYIVIIIKRRVSIRKD